MDLTRAVGYRGSPINLLKRDAVSHDLVGTEITRAEYMGVRGIGYEEKAALADGFIPDAMYLGKRIVDLTGNVYGRTREEAYAQALSLANLMDPADAYQSEQGASVSDRGFHPLDFYIPHAVHSAIAPEGLLHVMLMARPVAGPTMVFTSDGTGGGQDDQGLSIPWSARLECFDPRMYSYSVERVALGDVTSGMGTITNHGNRPAPIFVQLAVPASYFGSAVSNATFWLNLGRNQLRLTVPHAKFWQVIRYRSADKIVRLATAGGRTDAVRMDLLNITKGTHPFLNPGESVAYSWHSSGFGTGTGKFTSSSFLDFRHVWS